MFNCPEKLSIGIYVGSFDPFHKGHQSVCEYMIHRQIVNVMYILPNVPCKSKPDRSSLEHRMNMIKLQLLSLESNPNDCTDYRTKIIVDETDGDNVITSLRSDPNNYIVLVLGSDRYYECIHKNKTPLNELSIKYINSINQRDNCVNDSLFDEYIIVHRVLNLVSFSKEKNGIIINNGILNDFFGKPCRFLIDVSNQNISSTLVRAGDHNHISPIT
jgi:cytidyltransferase-like protein